MNIEKPANRELTLQGLTQIELARRLKVSRTYLSMVMNGFNSPRMRLRIANALGKPVSELFPDETLNTRTA